ncbi:hypothetical protein F5B19DRAFT_259005 [Rostrohypoxylon terebratum]|nr:hypothetical protein F5B19DRAFT_259005 [Rostrohypoxylon terebratum]
MHLLDFSPEILHNILLFACLSRGLLRAVRLNLVCRTFYNMLNIVLYQTELPGVFLDNPDLLCNPYLELLGMRSAEKFWVGYISYRVRMKSNNRDVSTQIRGRYHIDRHLDVMRKVVEELCIRVGADFEPTLDALCWPAWDHLCDTVGYHTQLRHDHFDMNSCLLGAAAYLGHLPLIKQLEKRKLEGHKMDPLVESVLFPCPLYLAALSGNIEVWRDLQKHYLDPEVKIHNSISGALRCDNMDMIREVDTFLGISNIDERIGCHIRSLDALYFAKERWSIRQQESFDEKVLSNGVLQGRVDIVRDCLVHLQDGRIRDNKWCKHLSLPLRLAIGNGHGEIVDLFLENGITPGALGGTMRWSLPMVHRLIDHGVNIDKCYHSVVSFAVRDEHTELLEFMLRRKVCHPILKKRLKDFALRRGSESMAEILQQHIENDPIRYLKRCDVELECSNIREFDSVWDYLVEDHARCRRPVNDDGYTVYEQDETPETIIDSLDDYIIADDS